MQCAATVVRDETGGVHVQAPGLARLGKTRGRSINKFAEYCGEGKIRRVEN